MDEKRSRVVSVGEVMIEIARGEDRVLLGCGGDTFNTAVYLARAGIEVAFATALGDDPYSVRILALAGAEASLATSSAGCRAGCLVFTWSRATPTAGVISIIGAAIRRRASFSNWRNGRRSARLC